MIAPQPGEVVHYYSEGWRYGYLHSVKKDVVTIRPIVSRYASQPRNLKVQRNDVEEFRNMPPVLEIVEPEPEAKRTKKKVKKCRSVSTVAPRTTRPTPARTASTATTSAPRPAKQRSAPKPAAVQKTKKAESRASGRLSPNSAKRVPPSKPSKPTKKAKKGKKK